MRLGLRWSVLVGFLSKPPLSMLTLHYAVDIRLCIRLYNARPRFCRILSRLSEFGDIPVDGSRASQSWAHSVMHLNPFMN